VRLNITWQFSLVITIVLLLVMTLFAFFDLHFLQRFFYQIARDNADRQCQAFIQGARHLMLENNRASMQGWVEGAGGQPGVRSLRLINSEGVVTFATDPGQVGRVLDRRSDPACAGCHLGGTPRVQATTLDRSWVFTDEIGDEVMGVARGIYNSPECSSRPCHFRSVNVLGVLDMRISLDESRELLASYRNQLMVEIVFVILAISLSLAILTQKLINQPVRQLLEHTRSLARGEWGEIKVSPGDELGELGESFNSMTRKLKDAIEERDHWATTLEDRVEERAREIRKMQSVLIRSEKLASVGELTAGVAHELNNPLTGILILSTHAVKRPGIDPVVERDFATIVREVTRCSRIVKGLLDFARETAPRKGRNSINETLDRSLALIQHHSLFQDITIVRNLGKDLPNVLLDSGQMEQVFLNILVNAGQAMEKGGELTLSTGMCAGEREVFASIRDSGCGIPEESLARIFDPFFTTKGTRGTGLGLSVSYGIVENHGGRIEVHSEVGVGTEFTVILPVEDPGRAERGEGAKDG
jgi:two-component system, NtrC family, sensor kinase